MKSRIALLAIAGFYFCYFAFNGIFSPYWGLYLAGLAFPAWQIGILTSLTQINRIYAPAIWSYLADRSGKRLLILRLAGIGGLVFFIPLLWSQQFWPLFIAVFLGSFFWSAALPLVEATSMSLLKGDTGAYARLRLWGSVGFVVATLLAGAWFESSGIGALPLLVISIMATLALYCWWVPEAPAGTNPKDVETGFFEILRRREVQALLLTCFLMAFAHGPFYSFYSIYVESHGFSKSTIAWLWTLGVLAEILIFWFMPKLNLHFSHKLILIFGLLIAVLRFATIGWGVASLVLLCLAQLAHAFTFGSNHAANMAYIHRYFPGRHQAKGQALYIAMSFGIGGSLGGVLAGLAWDVIGGAWVFTIAAACCLMGAIIAWRGLPKA